MKPYQKSLIALSFLSFLSTSHANSSLAFAELEQEKIEMNRSQEEKIAEFHAYINNYLDEYEQWRKAYTTNLDKQRVQLIEQWGSGDLSDQTQKVEYTKDNTVRKVINYEDNTATISIILDPLEKNQDINSIAKDNAISVDGQTLDLQHAKITYSAIDYSPEQENKEKAFIIQQTEAQMKEFDIQADRLIESQTGIPDSFIYERANNKKMHLLAEAQQRVSQINKLYKHQRKELGIPEPILVKSKEQPTVAAITDTTAVTDVALTKPVQAKKVVSYTIKLPNNSLKKRAIKYQELAIQESAKWGIDKALVMAIMHSESAFRADAKSHVPAFGLMQIVPVSAGHDVNKQMRKIDAPMTAEELYIPPVNVETGTAYLHILNSKYLRSITNEQSRLYCTIAAYNTGAGNVARAFNLGRSTNIRKAAKIINKMTPDEVYSHLLANLPYDETKNYLKKVNSRIELYK